MEIRRSQDRLISTMGIPILVRHLYIESGPRGPSQYKDQYRNSHYKGKMISWPSYLYNGNPPGKTTPLCWIRALAEVTVFQQSVSDPPTQMMYLWTRCSDASVTICTCRSIHTCQCTFQNIRVSYTLSQTKFWVSITALQMSLMTRG